MFRLFLLFALCCAAQPCFAANHQLTGTVADITGAVIPGTKLTAQCGPYRTEAVAGADGSFTLALRQSTCTVTAVAAGFALSSQVVEFSAASPALNLRLQVASGAEVTVSARQDTVDVTKICADPMDIPLSVASVPHELIQEQGFTRIFDVVRNVSGVTPKEAYFGLTDNFNVRGFDASASLFNGFRRDYYGTFNDLSSLSGWTSSRDLPLSRSASSNRAVWWTM